MQCVGALVFFRRFVRVDRLSVMMIAPRPNMSGRPVPPYRGSVIRKRHIVRVPHAHAAAQHPGEDDEHCIICGYLSQLCNDSITSRCVCLCVCERSQSIIFVRLVRRVLHFTRARARSRGKFVRASRLCMAF